MDVLKEYDNFLTELDEDHIRASVNGEPPIVPEWLHPFMDVFGEQPYGTERIR
jgi:hypothetical protein